MQRTDLKKKSQRNKVERLMKKENGGCGTKPVEKQCIFKQDA